ncbi:PP2C family protein-serine/threonine phosphatase [Streptomyces dubilierae]|uniref:PP2C family protein-serine/threonine phosphatase n=1 Tax=Streptomyces dubilierae TaxID=3075533 RepID=A0ABU2PCW0_9ACTN|nr:PP2C family protein-serine/threonine phosphatase [Streptomyces sp. DSM 41921]MDT0389997.1 PP2C family protein-serine/threonine phosphatase [Streptomyces sp. DSM 41921]
MIRVRARVRCLGLPTVWGAAAVTYKLACPLAQQGDLPARILTSAVFFAVGTGLILHVRRSLTRELRQLRRVAGAAQHALLRPPPSRVGGLDVAAAQVSAERGAAIGGDLYEVVATEHGVRAVMGDVRGHGIGAFGTVAAVLGCFREAAHDEKDLGGVLRRLERALDRHLRQEHPAGDIEEFVTLLLVEIRADGEIVALNCGHPWPYRVSGREVEQLAAGDPYPPLGLFPLPPVLPTVGLGRLEPDDALFLFTDGAQDARDARGAFFPLATALTGAAADGPLSAPGVVGRISAALRHHIRGTPPDDIALLVLRNGRSAPLGARGTARTTTTHPQTTTAP